MDKKLFPKLNLGFTLLELTIVMGLIAMLSLGGLASYTASQRRGRDAKRQTDLETVRQALELYKSDLTFYPTATSALSPTYLPSVPDDPSVDRDYYYAATPAGCTGSACTGYILCANLEINPATAACTTVSCGTAGNCDYQTVNP